jgi:hypothetical protein
MDIEELCRRFNNGLNGYLIAVQNVNYEVVIQIEMNDWKEIGSRRRFELRPTDVTEYKTSPASCEELEFLDDHPLLWNHNFSWEDLYFSSPPQCFAEVFGKLYETHEKTCHGWRSLADYLNTSLLWHTRSHGLLASGPAPLIEHYTKAIQDLLKVYTIETKRVPQQSKVLTLDESFVICKDVSVAECG